MPPVFVKLNVEWNAEPNSPEPVVEVMGRDVELRFFLNAFIYLGVEVGDVGYLLFTQRSRYRLGHRRRRLVSGSMPLHRHRPSLGRVLRRARQRPTS